MILDTRNNRQQNKKTFAYEFQAYEDKDAKNWV